MFLSNILRFIGPVKLIVLSLSVLLPIIEFADGAFDVGDVCAFLILLLLLDDILNTNLSFLFSRKGVFSSNDGSGSDISQFDNAQKISFKGKFPTSHYLFISKEGILHNHHSNHREGLADMGLGKDPLWRSLPMRESLANKRKMSAVFLILMMLPIVLEWFKMPESVYEVTFSIVMVIWSVALFTNSFMEYRKSIGVVKLKLFYCHLAAFVFVAGIIRLSFY